MPMTMIPRLIVAAFAALLFVPLPHAVTAAEFSTQQRSEIERIIREYLVGHPEVLQEAMAELEKRQTAAEAEKHKAAVKQNAQALFSIAASGRARQRQGRRHLRRVLRLQLRLLQARHERHAHAAQGRSQTQGRAQGISGARARLGGSRARSPLPCACRTRPARNTLNSTSSCSAAAARPTRRAPSPSPRTSAWTWRGWRRTWPAPRSRQRWRKTSSSPKRSGLNGTPSYVIGEDVVVGAIGLQGLQEKINTARCGKPSC